METRINPQLVWDKSLAFYKSKDYKACLDCLETLDKALENDTICFYKAQCYWMLGKYKKSLKSFQKTYQITEQPEHVLLPFVKALISLNKRKKAKQIIQEGLKQFPGNQEFILYAFLLNNKTTIKANIIPLLSSVKSTGVNSLNTLNLLKILNVFGYHQEKIKDLATLIEPQAANNEIVESMVEIKKVDSKITLLNLPIDVLNYSLEQITVDGLIIEAGVYYGMSLKVIAKHFKHKKVYGFDSFSGLPESWKSESAGSYSTHGELPNVAKNVKLKKGWFKDSIPKFISKHDEPIGFLHIDCDLYSSTFDVLMALKDNFVKGTIVLFNDFYGFKDYKQHEWKALKDFLKQSDHKVDYLACCVLGRELVVKFK